MKYFSLLPMNTLEQTSQNAPKSLSGSIVLRKKIAGYAFIFSAATFSSLGALAAGVYEVRLTWDSWAQRTDLDLSVENSRGEVVDYAHKTSTWGAKHTRDDLGAAYSNSYESFSIDINTMNCLGGDYKFYISHYSGPSVTSRVSASDGTNYGYLDIYTKSKDKALAFTYTGIPQNCIGNQISNNIIDLRKSSWNQPRIPYKIPGGRDKEYSVGCTTVAVGTVIDYYLKSGYADGWLDTMLSGVTVYPRFEMTANEINSSWNSINWNLFNWLPSPTLNNYFVPNPSTRYGFNVANQYNSTNDSNVDGFLKEVSFGLDSQFLANSLVSGGDIYPFEPEGASNWSEKIATLLRDRFRFNAIPYYPTRTDNWKSIYARFLKQGQPILLRLSLNDANGITTAGHAVVMDGYKEVNGHPEFRINFGWGAGHRCSEQWNSFESSNKINMSCRGDFDHAVIDGMVVAKPVR